ncbi:hypothetical protein F4821DRAFT_272466 [Hypoxylon rubiginosum]|uniref:Uncharacterized protein n=1 Tax=Hypoxylon rubiginosum TaxID=110542 RepID=A0ACC0CPV1_9PEZI|nr:hypothetical protein F4821DRAFT_272466 [Hypoxylon rubiginosum]
MAPPGANGCDLCWEPCYECIRQFPRMTPRLQAVANTHGQIAYRKGSVIGWLLGKIMPENTVKSDDRVLDFVRPDIEGEPAVCQLDCREHSNCFRLLNHNCNPPARLMQRKVSGRYVAVVTAGKDIYDGTEITISYGANH